MAATSTRRPAASASITGLRPTRPRLEPTELPTVQASPPAHRRGPTKAGPRRGKGTAAPKTDRTVTSPVPPSVTRLNMISSGSPPGSHRRSQRKPRGGPTVAGRAPLRLPTSGLASRVGVLRPRGPPIAHRKRAGIPPIPGERTPAAHRQAGRQHRQCEPMGALLRRGRPEGTRHARTAGTLVVGRGWVGCVTDPSPSTGNAAPRQTSLGGHRVTPTLLLAARVTAAEVAGAGGKTAVRHVAVPVGIPPLALATDGTRDAETISLQLDRARPRYTRPTSHRSDQLATRT